jgi:hypothetical protein
MATVSLHSVEDAVGGTPFSYGESSHILVVADATNVVATKSNLDTVDYGDPLAGSILVGVFSEIAFDTGTLRVLHVT